MTIRIIIGAYGALSLIAAILQGKYKNIPLWSAGIMGAGGLLMLASLLMTGVTSIILVTTGAILAHISAIVNGMKMYGEINKKHHVTRFAISAVIIVGMIMEQQW